MKFTVLNNRLTMYVMTIKPGMKTKKKAAFRVYNDTVIGLRCVSCNIAERAAFWSPFQQRNSVWKISDCTWNSGGDLYKVAPMRMCSPTPKREGSVPLTLRPKLRWTQHVDAASIETCSPGITTCYRSPLQSCWLWTLLSEYTTNKNMTVMLVCWVFFQKW